MRRGAWKILLPAVVAVLAAPLAASPWHGDYGGEIEGAWSAPAPPRYAQGYDAPRRPPRPGWYRAEYGARGERSPPPPPAPARCAPDRGGSILGAIAGGLLGGGDRSAPTFASGALADRGC